MQSSYKTERLAITRLTPNDVDFIFELVNTAGWLKFIGDRKIRTKEDAANYIQKILANPDIHYRVVKTQEQLTPVGIVTFIKRNYLQHHDIGFAFLPTYSKQGYAYEATLAVLSDLLKFNAYKTILATTIGENNASIRLLKKLGFTFNEEIKKENELLHLYSITKDKLTV